MAKKNKPMEGLVSDGIAPKAGDGKFAERPKILEEFNQKQQRIIQSRQLGAIKKGDASKDALPDGVRKSIENKERINEVIGMAGSNDVDSIKERYSIDATPLTRSKAKQVRDARTIKFGIESDSRFTKLSDKIIGVNVKKKEIAERVAYTLKINDDRIVNKIVNLLFAEIKLTLINGNQVVISGFGTWETFVIKAHKSVDLFTGVVINVPNTTVIKFKPAKKLRDALEK